MDLDSKWDWENRKLPCKVKAESGNPAADELRARLREIAQRLAVEQLKVSSSGWRPLVGENPASPSSKPPTHTHATLLLYTCGAQDEQVLR